MKHLIALNTHHDFPRASGARALDEELNGGIFSRGRAVAWPTLEGGRVLAAGQRMLLTRAVLQQALEAPWIGRPVAPKGLV